MYIIVAISRKSGAIVHMPQYGRLRTMCECRKIIEDLLDSPIYKFYRFNFVKL